MRHPDTGERELQTGSIPTEQDSRMVVRQLLVAGIVQAVGFRPFVCRLASEIGLDGWVRNDGDKVLIEVRGSSEAVNAFEQRLLAEPPPLARIDELTGLEGNPSTDAWTGRSRSGFTIEASLRGDQVEGSTPVPADTACCWRCRDELFDSTNRRFRYPFISCTDCGPRFTIIKALPYDRRATTMAPFPLCSECELEYHDPTDRRFHAQPIGCHRCGPRLRYRSTGIDGLTDADADVDTDTDVLDRAVSALQAGKTLAIKGVGGYQMACDASNPEAVAELRRRKNRQEKPLALLVASLEMATDLVDLDESEQELLASPARPIVLAPRAVARRRSSRSVLGVADAVAPGQPRLGVMMAPSPLHDLLATSFDRPLVLTSANLSGQPMLFDDDQAEHLLDELVDAMVSHDRAIHAPVDDSVIRVVAATSTTTSPMVLRRARGYAPTEIVMPPVDRAPTVLAVGALLKNTFCLAGTDRAWVSQHLGDLDDLATFEALSSTVERFEQFYSTTPEVVGIDAHPDGPGRTWARNQRPDLPVVEVQHHHAHIASVMAEHGLDPSISVLGFAFDGTGYGPDPTNPVWGGEVMIASGAEYRRVAHLDPVSLPGGDSAVVNPYRVALAYLFHSGLDWSPSLPPVAEALRPSSEGAGVEVDELALLARQLETGFGCVATSSMGRLFDAVAALVGLRQRISYEAQGAIELELAATRRLAKTGRPSNGSYRFSLVQPSLPDQPEAIDHGPVLVGITNDWADGRPVEEIAADFHLAVAQMVTGAVGRHRASQDQPVVLSGGVFQNALLVKLIVEALSAQGITVLTNRIVPPNDGGIALGQAYVARSTYLSQGELSCV